MLTTIATCCQSELINFNMLWRVFISSFKVEGIPTADFCVASCKELFASSGRFVGVSEVRLTRN